MSCCISNCPYKRRSSTIGLPPTSFHVFPRPDKELYRFNEWIKACNNPEIDSKDPEKVYKQHRICRRHFDTDCFNGGCRRILETAVPTLFLAETFSGQALTGLKRTQPSEEPLDDAIKYELIESADPPMKKTKLNEDDSDREFDEEEEEEFQIQISENDAILSIEELEQEQENPLEDDETEEDVIEIQSIDGDEEFVLPENYNEKEQYDMYIDIESFSSKCFKMLPFKT